MFSQFCTAFLKSTCNFEHFERKDEPDSLCFSEFIDCASRDYVNV